MNYYIAEEILFFCEELATYRRQTDSIVRPVVCRNIDLFLPIILLSIITESKGLVL